MDVSRTWQFKACAASTANSTALLFSTGSAPGSPRHTGHTFVLGGTPNLVEHPQKILVFVSRCTCTSSPITGSYFSRTVAGGRGFVSHKEILGPKRDLFFWLAGHKAFP